MKTVFMGLTMLILIMQSANSQEGKWVRYGIENSKLPNNYVHAIQFDTSGNAWIGTDSGLTRFDGTTWTTFDTKIPGVLSSAVRTLAIDQFDNVWAGTDWFLILFQDHGKKRTYLFDLFKQNEYPEGLNKIKSLMKDNAGNMWIATGIGIVRINCRTVADNLKQRNFPFAIFANGDTIMRQCYNIDTIITKSSVDGPLPLIEDRMANIWVADGALRKFDGSTWHMYDIHSGEITDNTPIRGTSFLCIQADKQDNLWLATFIDGLMKFNGSTFEKVELPNPYLIAGGVHAINVDQGGHVWIGTSWRLLEFDGSKWIVHNTTNSNEEFTEHSAVNSANVIHCIAFDARGSIWVGTDAGIAVKMR